MSTHPPHKPHHVHNEPAGEPVPGLNPVEPDLGPVPPPDPEDDDGQGTVPEV